MTRCATSGVSERSTVNQAVTDSDRCSGQPPRLPKFVDHPELKGRWAYDRIITKPAEPTTYQPSADRDSHRFKRMHFCAYRMKTLIGRYGARAAQGSDYQRFALLHQQLRDEIAQDHLGLVYTLYRRCPFPYADSDDLLSEGMMALMRAIEMFNPWLGFCFSTYACNAIKRAVYRQGRRNLRPAHRASLDAADNIVAHSDWTDTCHVEGAHLYVERLHRILSEDTAELSVIEKNVLKLRFPLCNEVQQPTLVAIGDKMNLSKERIRQIVKTALVKLRVALQRDAVLNPGSAEYFARSRGQA